MRDEGRGRGGRDGGVRARAALFTFMVVALRHAAGATAAYAKAMESGVNHTCAILDDDTAKCWGGNINGELGDGTNTDRSDPSALSAIDLGSGRTAKAISAFGYHTCAILDDDTAKCWGWNNRGQLGDGTTTDRNDPSALSAINLGSGRTAKAISVGGFHTCAILDDDTAKCWGANGGGRLGDGTTTNRNDPSALSAINLGAGRTAKAISAGAYHTCAILDDDTAKCWGVNARGQLGDGTTTNRNDPSALSAINLGAGRTAKAISAGLYHTCAILDDDTAKCWGGNINGQLGDGTTTNRIDPSALSAINLGAGRTAKAISAGGFHTCAILDDDTAKCWGANGGGRLGDGTTTNRSDPSALSAINLGSGRTSKTISTVYHTCAILDDDTAKCWGWNNRGQLGDGTTTDRSDPSALSAIAFVPPSPQSSLPPPSPASRTRVRIVLVISAIFFVV